MSGVLNGLYSAFVKRNSVFLATIFTGAFATNIAFDIVSNKVWDQINKGRQWKDIKYKYMQAGEEDDDE